MKVLSDILSEGKKYTFSGDYLVQRSVEDLGRHLYTFNGEFSCLSDGRVLGLIKDRLDSNRENLLLGLLNENRLEFYEISFFQTRFYTLNIVRPNILNFEGKSLRLNSLSDLKQMIEEISEINMSYNNGEKKYEIEHLFNVERKRLEKYFQNPFIQNVNSLGNLTSVSLREVKGPKFQN